MTEKEDVGYRITPKGAIFISLGGYTGGDLSKDNTQKVINALKFQMGTEYGLAFIDDVLTFIKLEPAPRKKFLGLF